MRTEAQADRLYIVGDDLQELKRIISALNLLSHGPRYEVLNHKFIAPLYKPQCGALRSRSGTYSGGYQNLEELWVVACQKLRTQIATFVELHTDIVNEDLYPLLCRVQKAGQDAVLNTLPEMPVSPDQLMQVLKDTRGENGAPFGRMPLPE